MMPAASLALPSISSSALDFGVLALNRMGRWGRMDEEKVCGCAGHDSPHTYRASLWSGRDRFRPFDRRCALANVFLQACDAAEGPPALFSPGQRNPEFLLDADRELDLVQRVEFQVAAD